MGGTEGVSDSQNAPNGNSGFGIQPDGVMIPSAFRSRNVTVVK
jgi:hypothetical protein